MKKLTEENEGLLFKYYNLTDLMLLEVNGKKKYKKVLENSALHELLYSKLEEYGLTLFGQFKEEELTFRCVRLLEGFPIENEPILKQLYGYEDFEAHIQLNGFDGFATAFNYNTTTGKCELQRHRWGITSHRVKFNNLESMLEAIGDREEETYNEVFEV